MALLEINDLRTFFTTKRGIIKAVNGVSYTVESGRTLGVVGESGSGKSVSAMSILRLLDANGYIDGGSIMFEGRDMTRLPISEVQKIRGNKISVIFQEPMTSLNPVFTIERQVSEPFMIHQGMNRREAAVKAVEMLRDVKIPNPETVVKQYPHQLSGGMRQRVMIAMALITRPEILIADEPTTALDVTVQKQVLDIIRKLQQDMGTSVILITHDLGVVRQYADRINVMYAGRIVESAPAKELLEHPRHAYTRALMKSIPGLHAKGTPLYTIPGLPPNMTQEPCGCSFRPRNTLGNPALCLTDREPELVEISPGHSVQNCPGCLA